jgi:hypothetical protein
MPGSFVDHEPLTLDEIQEDFAVRRVFGNTGSGIGRMVKRDNKNVRGWFLLPEGRPG